MLHRRRRRTTVQLQGHFKNITLLLGTIDGIRHELFYLSELKRFCLSLNSLSWLLLLLVTTELKEHAAQIRVILPSNINVTECFWSDYLPLMFAAEREKLKVLLKTNKRRFEPEASGDLTRLRAPTSSSVVTLTPHISFFLQTDESESNQRGVTVASLWKRAFCASNASYSNVLLLHVFSDSDPDEHKHVRLVRTKSSN